MFKRGLATGMAILLSTAAMTGCAMQSGVQTASQSQEEEQSVVEESGELMPVDESVPAAEEAAAPEEEATPSAGDITEINVYVVCPGTVTTDADAVLGAMNEITEKTIGVHANISLFNVPDYMTQLPMAIAGNDSVDLAIQLPTAPVNFETMYASNQLMDMTEYLEEEAPFIMTEMADYMDTYKVGGRIYGVPTYRDYGQSVYLYMRKDILEETGMLEKANALETWSDMVEIFDAVAEKTDLSPTGGNKSGLFNPGVIFGDDDFSNDDTYDTLGDTMFLIYTDEEGNVSLLPEQEGFKAQADRTRDLWNNSYIYKDTLIDDTGTDVLIKDGVLFSGMQISEFGAETAKQAETGHELVVKKLVDLPLTTAMISKFGVVMPVTASEPEAAVRWLNALYESSELMNLFDWGIEGTHYVVNDGQAAFPEGTDMSSTTWHFRDFVLGNPFNALPWDGQGAEYRSEAMDDLKSFDTSSYLGFMADMTGLENVITGLNSVYNKYRADVFCGNYSDELYDEYLSALKAADVDSYISAFQEQLNTWKAN